MQPTMLPSPQGCDYFGFTVMQKPVTTLRKKKIHTAVNKYESLRVNGCLTKEIHRSKRKVI